MKKFFFDEIPIKNYVVYLKFKKPITFHFYHGAKLYGLISSLLKQHPISQENNKINDVIIYPCETGRIHYSAGDYYTFGISFINGNLLTISDFIGSLKRIDENLDKGELNKESIEFIDIKEITNIHKNKISKKNYYTINLITPLRVERKDEDKEEGKKYFDTSFFEIDQFFKLLYKRIADIYKSITGNYPFTEVPKNPLAEIISKNFIWVDMPKEHGTLGGIMGKFSFKAELDEFWQKLLWFGQFVNIGRNSAFGFGKYTIENDPYYSLLPKPSNSYLDKILNINNLYEAFEHIKNNSDFMGYDGVPMELFEYDFEESIDVYSDKIINGTYKPSPLTGIIINKGNGKVRALAIPSIKDRILQRSVMQVINDTIEYLLEDNSFAYRKGYSRIGAARAINKYYNAGYKYILESDIESFFDNVNWEILESKLNIIFKDELLINLIMQWVKCDVHYKGKLIKREKGIPQGSAISPLLANLYLDEFDEALNDNFKLVRYADDFVILCKSIQHAESALEDVKEALANLKLNVKESKTNIVSFDDGFNYLGYLFVKSVIVEKKNSTTLINNDVVITESSIPKGSWLTLVDFKNVKDIKNISNPIENNIQNLNSICINLDKYPVYVLNNSEIMVENDTLVLTNNYDTKHETKSYNFKDINFIVVIGYSKMTLPAIFKLTENNIPIYFCHPNGQIKLNIPIAKPNFSFWDRQYFISMDKKFILDFAKEIITAKINNHKVLTRRSNYDYVNPNYEKLILKAEFANDTEQLLGFEGSSANLFFDFIENSVSDEWSFFGRRKNPPEDPINSLLSFGYTIIYNYISTFLIAEGFNPQIGLYHKSSNRYYPLACDLQEEFRFLIDSLVLYLVHRNMVSLKDFVIDKSNIYPCLMTKEFRKKYITLIEEKLMTEFTPKDFTKKITYKDFIYHQVNVLKNCFKTGEMKYKALRIK